MNFLSTSISFNVSKNVWMNLASIFNQVIEWGSVVLWLTLIPPMQVAWVQFPVLARKIYGNWPPLPNRTDIQMGL